MFGLTSQCGEWECRRAWHGGGHAPDPKLIQRAVPLIMTPAGSWWLLAGDGLAWAEGTLANKSVWPMMASPGRRLETSMFNAGGQDKGEEAWGGDAAVRGPTANSSAWQWPFFLSIVGRRQTAAAWTAPAMQTLSGVVGLFASAGPGSVADCNLARRISEVGWEVGYLRDDRTLYRKQ